MAEATSATILTHCNSNGSNFALLTEECAYCLLSSVETNVSAENAVTFSWRSTYRAVTSGLVATEFDCNVSATVVGAILSSDSLGCIRVLFVLDESDSS